MFMPFITASPLLPLGAVGIGCILWPFENTPGKSITVAGIFATHVLTAAELRGVRRQRHSATSDKSWGKWEVGMILELCSALISLTFSFLERQLYFLVSAEQIHQNLC